MTQSLPPKSTVLYADDDWDDIELVKNAFQSYSNAVDFRSFQNGVELLNYLKNLSHFEQSPCLIILDINMPVKGGKEVLKELRNIKAFEETPVVLFSTSTLPSEVSFAKSYNAGFLTKPLYAVQLQQLVDRMIEHCTDETKRNLERFRKNS